MTVPAEFDFGAEKGRSTVNWTLSIFKEILYYCNMHIVQLQLYSTLTTLSTIVVSLCNSFKCETKQTVCGAPFSCPSKDGSGSLEAAKSSSDGLSFPVVHNVHCTILYIVHYCTLFNIV